MILVKPEIEMIDMPEYAEALKKIEKIGRACYKSEDRISEDPQKNLLQVLLKEGMNL